MKKLFLLALFFSAPAFADSQSVNDLKRQRAAYEMELADAQEARMKAAAMVKKAREKGYLAGERVANDAGLAAQQRIDDANERIRAIDDRLASTPTESGSAPRNLAKDPEIAKLLQSRLTGVHERIARLQKAKKLLSYQDNPTWQKEWDVLISDMRRDNKALGEVAYDGLTAAITTGYSDALKAATPFHLPPEDESKVGDAADRFFKTIQGDASLHDLSEKAGALVSSLKSSDIGDLQKRSRILGETRDLFSALGSVAERRLNGTDKLMSLETVTEASQALGEVAMGYLRNNPVAGEIRDKGGLVLKFGEATALQMMVWEDNDQMTALADRSADRQRKSQELDATIARLQDQERVLTDEHKRAAGDF